MSPLESTVLDDATAQELSERLADVFRTAEVGDVLTDDVFLDGHPPLWRFQLAGSRHLRRLAAGLLARRRRDHGGAHRSRP